MMRQGQKPRFARPSTCNRRTRDGAPRAGPVAAGSRPGRSCVARTTSGHAPRPFGCGCAICAGNDGLGLERPSLQLGSPSRGGAGPGLSSHWPPRSLGNWLLSRHKRHRFGKFLAEIDMEEGRREDALADAQEAVRLSPDDPGLRVLLGAGLFCRSVKKTRRWQNTKRH